MPDVEVATLASAITQSGTHETLDFIADESGRVDILGLTCNTTIGEHAERYRDAAVLLAMASQRETIAAVIALDGVARRLILWPQDRSPDQITPIAAQAGADFVVSVWPFGPATQGAARRVGPLDDQIHTEWILFTSGTTGQPKMVVHTLRSLAGHIVPPCGEAPRPIWCTFYDIRRYGGLQIALRALVGGGSLVLSSKSESMGAFLTRAANAGATHFLGTPSHWRLALMAGASAIIKPRYVRLSGEVSDQGILESLTKAFPDAALVHAFASTEAGLAFEVTDRRAGFPRSLIDECGAGSDLRVIDGTLQVRSARNAKGILDKVVKPVALPDGFIETGDAIVLLDKRYAFAGRQDGVVNVGGQKVFPEEVEAVINQHPAVQMSRVNARRNAITGAVVSAEVVRKLCEVACSTSLEKDLIAHCRQYLPPYKVPASVKLVPCLDVSPSGKLVRTLA